MCTVQASGNKHTTTFVRKCYFVYLSGSNRSCLLEMVLSFSPQLHCLNLVASYHDNEEVINVCAVSDVDADCVMYASVPTSPVDADGVLALFRQTQCFTHQQKGCDMKLLHFMH